MYYICLITPFYAIFVSVVFYAFGLYSKNYKTVGIHEVRRLLISNFFMILFYVILMNLIFKVGFPYVFFLVGGLLQFTFSMGIRFLYRLLKE
jgi:FlaA1/EpsC-like NDP-sugar epimerase